MNNIFTYLKNRLSILDVVNEYASLKRAGGYWKGHCPFHNEKTASFTVSPHKQIYYCFGCNTGGDVINFIEKIENCSALEAAKHLAQRFNIDLPEFQNQSSAAFQEKKQYYELCSLVAQWCHDQLLKSPSVLAYLYQRGIEMAMINRFKLGYFPGGLYAVKQFITFMNKHTILANDLIEAHILQAGKQVLFSPYEERIMFPIADHLGRTCGFGGRIFKAQDTRAKYYNSRESSYFEKGKLLFGLELAKKAIQESETAFLVEGYTDCIAMVQHGFTNTIATLGTACTLEHLTHLARYAQKLYIVYDGDNAGQQAMLRIAQLSWQASLELYIIMLPKGEDPASFLHKRNDLAALINQAPTIFDYFIGQLGTSFSSIPLAQKIERIRKIIDIITHIPDPLKQDLLLQQTAHALAVPFESLKKELTRSNEHQVAKTVPTPSPLLPDQPSDTPTKLEKAIFCAIITNSSLLNQANETYLITYLPSPLCTLVKTISELKNNVVNPSFNDIFSSIDPEYKQMISKMVLEYEQEEKNVDFEVLLLQLQKKHWKVIVNDIKIKLEVAKKREDTQEVTALLNHFLDLKKKLIDKEIL